MSFDASQFAIIQSFMTDSQIELVKINTKLTQLEVDNSNDIIPLSKSNDGFLYGIFITQCFLIGLIIWNIIYKSKSARHFWLFVILCFPINSFSYFHSPPNLLEFNNISSFNNYNSLSSLQSDDYFFHFESSYDLDPMPPTTHTFLYTNIQLDAVTSILTYDVISFSFSTMFNDTILYSYSASLDTNNNYSSSGSLMAFSFNGGVFTPATGEEVFHEFIFHVNEILDDEDITISETGANLATVAQYVHSTTPTLLIDYDDYVATNHPEYASTDLLSVSSSFFDLQGGAYTVFISLCIIFVSCLGAFFAFKIIKLGIYYIRLYLAMIR